MKILKPFRFHLKKSKRIKISLINILLTGSINQLRNYESRIFSDCFRPKTKSKYETKKTCKTCYHWSKTLLKFGIVVLELVCMFRSKPSLKIGSVQLNKYETAPNFILLSQNLTLDCLLI